MERVTRERSRLGHLANRLFKLEAKFDIARRPVEEAGNESQGKDHAADGMGDSAAEARTVHGEEQVHDEHAKARHKACSQTTMVDWDGFTCCFLLAYAFFRVFRHHPGVEAKQDHSHACEEEVVEAETVMGIWMAVIQMEKVEE